MLSRLSAVIVFVVSIGLQSQALSSSFFVSAKGNDQAEGSQDRPWQTIDRASQVIQAGDEVIVSGGLYRGGFVLSGLRGTGDHPIVIRAGEDQRVLIEGPAEAAPGIRLTDCAHVVMRGLEIANVAQGDGLMLHNSHHCRIEGNVVHQLQGVGIRLSASNDNIVLGNICYHSDTGIYVGSGSTRNLIEANVCAFGNQSSENADGIASSNCTENTYRFNILICNNDDGLDMWTSKRSIIEWNFACANGDQKEGDGNGFKLGGKWKNRGQDDPWDGGENVVRNNLSVWNLSTGFTDNGSSGNKYERNVSFGNLNTGSYASVEHSAPEGAERIRAKIRQRFAALIAERIIRPTVNPLPLGVGLLRELKVWPQTP